jgi:predicted nucleic acid-binding protein
LIVVVDASTLVSAALKIDSIPERALLRAVNQDNRLLLSQEVEDEYREVIFRPKFDRYVSIERRQRILDIVAVAAERMLLGVTRVFFCAGNNCADTQDCLF